MSTNTKLAEALRELRSSILAWKPDEPCPMGKQMAKALQRIEEALAAPAEQAAQAVPAVGSPEASALIDSELASYGWPANPKNAARAGYEACRKLMQAAPAPEAQPRVSAREVYAAMGIHAHARTPSENVQDVLDALDALTAPAAPGATTGEQHAQR